MSTEQKLRGAAYRDAKLCGAAWHEKTQTQEYGAFERALFYRPKGESYLALMIVGVTILAFCVLSLSFKGVF